MKRRRTNPQKAEEMPHATKVKKVILPARRGRQEALGRFLTLRSRLTGTVPPWPIKHENGRSPSNRRKT
jgi:hypothetical protein